MTTILDNSEQILREYESIGQEFKVKAAQKMFMEALICGKEKIIHDNKLKLNKTQIVDVAFRNLSLSIRNYQTLQADYDYEIQRSKMFEADKERRIAESKGSLEKNIEAKSSNEKTELMATKNLLISHQEKSNALLVGLTKLLGVRIVELIQSSDTSGIKMIIEVGDIEVALILSENMKLEEIQSISQNKELESKLIRLSNYSKTLSPPQDLRYAIFALRSIQTSNNVKSSI